MSTSYLQIENVTGGVEEKIKQTLKFKTGNFVWRVRFTTALNPQTVNNVNMYVTNLNQVPLMTQIKYDTVHNYVEVEPIEPYSKDESYILHITKNVKSKGGQALKDNIQIQFKL